MVRAAGVSAARAVAADVCRADGLIWLALRHLPDELDRWSCIPFAAATALFSLDFAGLAYSFYPYVVPDRMTIYDLASHDVASAPESLLVILLVTVFVLTAIRGCTALAYTLFRGKASELLYD